MLKAILYSQNKFFLVSDHLETPPPTSSTCIGVGQYLDDVSTWEHWILLTLGCYSLPQLKTNFGMQGGGKR